MASTAVNSSSRRSSVDVFLKWNTAQFLFFFLLLSGTVLTVRAAPPHEIELQLEQARSNLLLSQATEERIISEMESLRASGKEDPGLLEDYEAYLDRVQAMVAENRKIVRGMEDAYTRHLRSEKTGGFPQSTSSGETPPAAFNQEEEAGELDTLDRELKDSLSSFDQLLLKEMDAIRIQSESTLEDLARDAASAAQRIKERGEGSGEPPGEKASAQGSTPSAAEELGQKGSQRSGRNESGGSYERGPVTDSPVDRTVSESGTAAKGGRAQQPAGSTQDDDIVARQLREAAENETDPELKKKLWKEYEDYKKAGR